MVLDWGTEKVRLNLVAGDVGAALGLHSALLSVEAEVGWVASWSLWSRKRNKRKTIQPNQPNLLFLYAFVFSDDDGTYRRRKHRKFASNLRISRRANSIHTIRSAYHHHVSLKKKHHHHHNYQLIYPTNHSQSSEVMEARSCIVQIQ